MLVCLSKDCVRKVACTGISDVFECTYTYAVLGDTLVQNRGSHAVQGTVQPCSSHAVAAMQQQLLQQQHACRFMHAGSCMPVYPVMQQQQHACMHAYMQIENARKSSAVQGIPVLEYFF